METKNQKIGVANSHGDAEAGQEIAGSSNTEAQVSRRRALLAGLAAAPVVLSLMNRSAWGAQVSCTLVASYVNAGNRWQSPRPSNNNGTLAIGQGDISSCHL